MKSRFFTVLFFFLFLSSCLSHTSKDVKITPGIPSRFLENKGQITDQNNKPNPAVLYLLNTPGMNVQLRRSGWSYDVYSVDNSKVKNQKSKLQFKSQNFNDSIVNCQLSIMSVQNL